MNELKPTLYLDKGALGSLDLRKVSDDFQVCYSEATLFDLLNDQSVIREQELSTLNEVGALYFFRDSEQVHSIHGDAMELMKKVDRLELEFMVGAYRFVNGGGTPSLFDILHHQLSTLLNFNVETRDVAQEVLSSVATDQTLEPLKGLKSEQWRIEMQRATKSWSQAQEITLRSVLDQNPDLSCKLKEFFPDTVPKPEKIQLAAMLLGVLQMGSDKGILSPDESKSGKAARNGYVDCLHVMFGLHCHVFITTDKATLRRFYLLNDYWQLGRKCALLCKNS